MPHGLQSRAILEEERTISKRWAELRPKSKASRLWLEHREDWKRATASVAIRLGADLSRQIDHCVLGDGALPEDGTLIAALNAGGSTLPVWSCLAMGLISELHQDPVAWSLTVFREAKAPARGWMMRFFHGPGEARDAILDVGLDDRSKRVRLWACEGTEYSHDRKRWLPRLALMRQSDPALEVREAAQHSHDIIDKGYRVNLKGGRWCFLVENQVGSIVACDFDEVAYRTYGEETLARMLMTRDSRLSEVEREMNVRRTAAG